MVTGGMLLLRELMPEGTEMILKKIFKGGGDEVMPFRVPLREGVNWAQGDLTSGIGKIKLQKLLVSTL